MHEIAERYKKLAEASILITAEHNLQNLFKLIIMKSLDLTNSDAGSIYLKERRLVVENNYHSSKNERYESYLKFCFSYCYSQDVSDLEQKTMPITTESIAGFVALHGETVILDDAYNIPKSYPFSFFSDFDKKLNYRTKSVIAIPMFNQKNEVIGVIQLLNKRSNGNIVAYTSDDRDILLSFASLAAVAIERIELYLNMQNLLESFVKSFTRALEMRDRTAEGHCQRVKGYALELAKRVLEQPKYSSIDKNIFLKQIEYAALLHDIGKITVPEFILNKHYRMLPEKLAIIEHRFILYKQYLKKQNMPEDKYSEECAKIDALWELINEINQKYAIDEKTANFIKSFENKQFEVLPGEKVYLLSPDELEALLVEEGNLTRYERQVVCKHVIEAGEVLRRVFWPDELSKVKDFVLTHHERLDGSGYPYGLKGDEIPLGGRILAIVDMFEALTTKKRPYRPPYSVTEALSIIEKDVNNGKLDKDIFKIFVENKIYRLFAEEGSDYVTDINGGS